MDDLGARVRLYVYRHFVDRGRAPSPGEIAAALGMMPLTVETMLRSLQADDDALVLLPGSPYVWMAEPFSAVPTSYVARSRGGEWFANCVWDALAILALVDHDGQVETWCPASGVPLRLDVRARRLEPSTRVVHFAVPAHRWWESIGHT
jgi:hypothetical protein